MYVSIDIETTGLDPETCQILEIGAIVWKTNGSIMQQPQFHKICNPGLITGEPYALNLNQRILKLLADDPTAYPNPANAVAQLMNFLRLHNSEKYTIMGKNFANFDLRFLERLHTWDKRMFGHRILDVGSMWATHEGIPKTPEIEIPFAGNPHEALYDAAVMLQLAREKLRPDHFGVMQ